jgi:carboxyl-terminal processing protease
LAIDRSGQHTVTAVSTYHDEPLGEHGDPAQGEPHQPWGRSWLRRMVGAVLWSWPVLVALAGAAVLIAQFWFDMEQWIQACSPSMRISGYCQPPGIADLLGELLPQAGTAFALGLVVALATRATIRTVLEARRQASSAASGPLGAIADPPSSIGTPHRERWTPNRRRAAAILVAGAIFGAGVGVDRVGLLGGPDDPAAFGLIRQGWDLLHTEYVGSSTLDSSELAHAAIAAMADAVGDTGHTYYLTADEAAIQAEDLAGSYIGVGIELDESGAMPVVSAVVADGPADSAGLQAGDVLLEIDGRSTQGMTSDDLTNALRGEAGTNVMVTVERAGTGARTSLTIARGVVVVPAVNWAMVPGTQVALISLTEFSDGVADELYRALGAVHAAGATGLVFDLRGNPGGLADEAIYVASEFLASGVVVQGRDRFGVVRAAMVDYPPADKNTPLVVLIDAGSASAAEVVAGALQDAGRAILVGEKTFGTGTTMLDFTLDDGSVLAIGIYEWLTRSGRSVWHSGVRPDIAVAMRDGTTPITPSELAALAPGALGTSRDAQLIAAMRELGYGAR